MSTEPKESEDVFAFFAANPDKLAKAQRRIPGSFHIYARNESSLVCNKSAVLTATMSDRKSFQLIPRGQTKELLGYGITKSSHGRSCPAVA